VRVRVNLIIRHSKHQDDDARSFSFCWESELRKRRVSNGKDAESKTTDHGSIGLVPPITKPTMADHHDAADDGGGNNNAFIYTGGRAPQHVTRVIIDDSIDVIEERAFYNCPRLEYIQLHNRVKRIKRGAFYMCRSLRRIQMRGVKFIDEEAFGRCTSLLYVELGDELEVIGRAAFMGCRALKRVRIPSSVLTISASAFSLCTGLMDIDFPYCNNVGGGGGMRLESIESNLFSSCTSLKRIVLTSSSLLHIRDYAFCNCIGITELILPDGLESIGVRSFFRCRSVGRIAMPLIDNIPLNAFDSCDSLTRIDLTGMIHTTVSRLHLESWRDQMHTEIASINDILPTTLVEEKTDQIRQWMQSVTSALEDYKAKHHQVLKEVTTHLELFLWGMNLGEDDKEAIAPARKKCKIDVGSARRERRFTSGANVIIKNVLPFLKLS
jgi:hypothetical protein